MVTLSCYPMVTFGGSTPPRMAIFSARPNSRRKSSSHLLAIFPCDTQTSFIARSNRSSLRRLVNCPPLVLTAANRDLSASDYVHLHSLLPSNVALFDTIHSAAFVLCVDPATPGHFLTTSRFL